MSDLDMEQFDKLLEPEAETPEEETPAQEAENVEEPAEEAEPEPQPEEKLYAGNFKSVEELERGYEELRTLEGRRSQELGELRKSVEELSSRIPEDEDDGYVPMDDANAQWFDTMMEENPVQAMEWARQNDASGMFYNRGLAQWYDTNPAQAGTYQAAVIAQGLRDEFNETLSKQTKPLQERASQDAERESFNEAWKSLAAEVPDLAEYAEGMLAESNNIPKQMMLGKSAEEKQRILHTLYRLAKGSAASSLETAEEEAEKERKQTARSAKLSGTSAPTKAVSPEPESEDPQWLQEFDAVLERRNPDQ